MDMIILIGVLCLIVGLICFLLGRTAAMYHYKNLGLIYIYEDDETRKPICYLGLNNPDDLSMCKNGEPVILIVKNDSHD